MESESNGEVKESSIVFYDIFENIRSTVCVFSRSPVFVTQQLFPSHTSPICNGQVESENQEQSSDTDEEDILPDLILLPIN